MDDSAVKESRQVLRRIQDHLFHAQAAAGVQHETVSFVDVIHHPTSTLPEWNYVTPRRNTAWVSGAYIQQGLDRLGELGRRPRVQYIEGLFPPLFAKTLHELGLQVECEMPLMVYRPGGLLNHTPSPPLKPPTPPSVRLELVSDQRGVEIWWYVWRNAFYDVLTVGGEPLAVGRDVASLRLGQQIEVLLYQHNFPVGVVQISMQIKTKSAQVTALALLPEARSPQLSKLLLAAAIRAAQARGCSLIFAPGEDENDRQLKRELGFIDVGSMVCYAARSETTNEDHAHDILVQSVLALRR